METVEGRAITVAPRNVFGEINVTYAFDLATSPEYELTAHSANSGYASTVYLTIGYKYAEEWMCLLTSVSGYWVISDPKASVESASVHYECTGLGQPASQSQTRSVSNNFSINTGFSTYVFENDIYSTIGASLTVNYLIGTSRRWSFTLNNSL